METLESGQVVPGYGHAVLRQPDPRFMAQKSFAETYCQGDPTVQIVWDLFELVPEILGSIGKVKTHGQMWMHIQAPCCAIMASPSTTTILCCLGFLEPWVYWHSYAGTELSAWHWKDPNRSLHHGSNH